MSEQECPDCYDTGNVLYEGGLEPCSNPACHVDPDDPTPAPEPAPGEIDRITFERDEARKMRDYVTRQFEKTVDMVEELRAENATLRENAIANTEVCNELRADRDRLSSGLRVMAARLTRERRFVRDEQQRAEEARAAGRQLHGKYMDLLADRDMLRSELRYAVAGLRDFVDGENRMPGVADAETVWRAERALTKSYAGSRFAHLQAERTVAPPAGGGEAVRLAYRCPHCERLSEWWSDREQPPGNCPWCEVDWVIPDLPVAGGPGEREEDDLPRVWWDPIRGLLLCDRDVDHRFVVQPPAHNGCRALVPTPDPAREILARLIELVDEPDHKVLASQQYQNAWGDTWTDARALLGGEK